MKKNLLPIALAALCLGGCSVMHFKNGDSAGSGPTMEKWHHNVAYSLWEMSPVVNLKTLCADKEWSVITTKETFLTGLAGQADDAVTGAILKGFNVDLWDPQLITWQCAGGASGAPASPAPVDPAK